MISAHEKRPSFHPIFHSSFHGSFSPDANFHWESRVFWAPFLEKALFLAHLQRFVGATSRNLYECYRLRQSNVELQTKCTSFWTPWGLWCPHKRSKITAQRTRNTNGGSGASDRPMLRANTAMYAWLSTFAPHMSPHSTAPRTYAHYSRNVLNHAKHTHPPTCMYVRTCHNFSTSQHIHAFAHMSQLFHVPARPRFCTHVTSFCTSRHNHA